MKLNLAKFLATGALLALTATGAVMAAEGVATSIDVQQAATLQSGGALLLDVREADEYAAVHAPGSTLIPLGQLAQRMLELGSDKNRPILLICRSGRRSAAALKILEQAGYSALQNVEGGMLAWQKMGLPVATGMAN